MSKFTRICSYYIVCICVGINKRMCGCVRLKKANEGGTLVMDKSETSGGIEKARTCQDGLDGVKSHFDDVSRRKAKKSG